MSFRSRGDRVNVNIDRDKCVSSGQCVLIASAVFDQDDDGLVVLLDASHAEAQQEKVREAAHVCPTGVITFSE